jgi:hypothetical protein
MTNGTMTFTCRPQFDANVPFALAGCGNVPLRPPAVALDGIEDALNRVAQAHG